MKRLINLCHNLVAGKTYSSILSPPCTQLSLLLSSSASSGHYNNYNVWQQYSTGATVSCWNCKSSVLPRSHIICTECGHLQDVDTKINYFDLLNFPIRFVVESKELSQRFRQLQALVHPDKFSNKSEREQSNSAEWSALINRAYKTLAAPLERGRYMLKMHGHNLPEDNSALNKNFLMEVMEANEQVDEANTIPELQVLLDNVVHNLEQEAITLSKHFDNEAYEEAINVLVKMKYLQSLQENIKNKLDKLRYEDN